MPQTKSVFDVGRLLVVAVFDAGTVNVRGRPDKFRIKSIRT